MMGESKAVTTIARERVEDLALRHAEPDWLKKVRLLAWEAYLQTPMPTPRDETWHRTDISNLDLSTLTALDFAPAETGGRGNASPQLVPEWIKPALDHFNERAGILAQEPHQSAYFDLPSELEAKGVIFCDLSTALKKHEEKVRQYLSIPAIADQDGKFGLMAKALFNCGLFLYVPPGVEIEAPFLSFISIGASGASTAGGAAFPRLLVVAGANSNLNLIHTAASVSGAGTDKSTDQTIAEPSSLHAGIVEIHALQGAKVSFLELQQFGSNLYSVSRTVGAIERDANLTSLAVALGGKLVKGDIASVLMGPGAKSEVLGVVLGDGHEHFNFNTIEEHDSPDTRSDINFRTALKDSATSIYQGIIRVAKVAQRTDAYQSNKNLLLGVEAKADSIPKLEILADDVKCSHGATVGPVDREQIFYLMSRGLTHDQAEELIVLGFFKTVLDKFNQPAAVEWVADAISSKIYHVPVRPGRTKDDSNC